MLARPVELLFEGILLILVCGTIYNMAKFFIAMIPFIIVIGSFFLALWLVAKAVGFIVSAIEHNARRR